MPPKLGGAGGLRKEGGSALDLLSPGHSAVGPGPALQTGHAPGMLLPR